MKSLFVALAVIFLNGCGSSSTTTYFTLNGAQYVAVGNDTLTKTETSVSGTGKLAFKDPLSRDKNNYSLTFTLTDGGSLTLVTHSDNALANGLNVQVTRTGATYAAKMVKGTTEAAMAGVTGDATGSITLKIDNHNNEPHVVVYSAADAIIFNSEDPGSEAAPGKGDGTVWGLELSGATLTTATLGEAKFSE